MISDDILVPEEALDRERVRKGGLHEFLRLAWSIVDTSPFRDGWHLQEMCTHLEAVSRGECKSLLINIPPGLSKSSTVCVFWPAWDWATVQHPEKGQLGWRQWIFASYDQGLSHRDALRCKELIKSEWFQRRWGKLADPRRVKDPVYIVSDGKQDTMGVYNLSGGGKRISTSMGGGITGNHADIHVIDDPHKPTDLEGSNAKEHLDKAEGWFTHTLSTRTRAPDLLAQVIIMQRLHQGDLSAVALKKGGWTHLRLPMRYEANVPCSTPFGGDRRNEEGELLCPERYNLVGVARLEEALGSRHAAGQLQQRPSPAGGSILKREWLTKRWRELPYGVRFIQSWDCAFHDFDTSSYVVGQLWATIGSQFFLVSQIRAKLDFVATCQAIRDTRNDRVWHKARAVLVEEKANGPAIISTIKKDIPGIIPWNPKTKSKEERLQAVAPYFEAGNVFLPERGDFVLEYVEELCTFPTSVHNDQVDATSQALLYMGGNSMSRFKEAMDRAASGR